MNCVTKSMRHKAKTELEDLYLPFKPKRRTKGQMAIEAGLETLADLLWNEPKMIQNQPHFPLLMLKKA